MPEAKEDLYSQDASKNCEKKSKTYKNYDAKRKKD